jgi:hypothetical protein
MDNRESTVPFDLVAHLRALMRGELATFDPRTHVAVAVNELWKLRADLMWNVENKYHALPWETIDRWLTPDTSKESKE